MRCHRTLLYAMLIVFAVLSIVYMDKAAAEWVRDAGFSPSTKLALKAVRVPGNYFFTIALAGMLYWRCRWSANDTFGLLLSGAMAGGVTAFLKFCFGRMRPFRGDGPYDWEPFALFVGPNQSFINPSFPSGDTALAFATAAVVAAMMPRWRWIAYLWACAVGITRVLQNAHYPSDVAIGIIVGVAVADSCRRLTTGGHGSSYVDTNGVHPVKSPLIRTVSTVPRKSVSSRP